MFQYRTIRSLAPVVALFATLGKFQSSCLMVVLLASMARPKGVQGLHPLATLCSRFGAFEGSVKALEAVEIERRLRLLEERATRDAK